MLRQIVMLAAIASATAFTPSGVLPTRSSAGTLRSRQPEFMSRVLALCAAQASCAGINLNRGDRSGASHLRLNRGDRPGASHRRGWSGKLLRIVWNAVQFCENNPSYFYTLLQAPATGSALQQHCRSAAASWNRGRRGIQPSAQGIFWQGAHSSRSVWRCCPLPSRLPCAGTIWTDPMSLLLAPVVLSGAVLIYLPEVKIARCNRKVTSVYLPRLTRVFCVCSKRLPPTPSTAFLRARVWLWCTPP